MPKPFYKKIFTENEQGGVALTNPEPVEVYVEEKAKSLCDCHTCLEEKSIKYGIFEDFIRIFEYDCDNAEFPPLRGVFKTEDDKRQVRERVLLYEDITKYLGEILCRFHYDKAHNKSNIPELRVEKFIIDYNQMYLYAANDYFLTLYGIPQQRISKIPGNLITEIETEIAGENIQYPIGDNIIQPGRYFHSYGSLFIFPMLLEHFLLVELQNMVLAIGLESMTTGIKSGRFSLDGEEQEIYNTWIDALRTGCYRDEGTMLQIMSKVCSLFEKYEARQLNDDKKRLLLGGIAGKRPDGIPNTMGTILNSEFAKTVIRPAYFKLLEYLFSTDRLNIRNNTMHGNNNPYDYTALWFSAINLQLIWDVAAGDIFEDSILKFFVG